MEQSFLFSIMSPLSTIFLLIHNISNLNNLKQGEMRLLHQEINATIYFVDFKFANQYILYVNFLVKQPHSLCYINIYLELLLNLAASFCTLFITSSGVISPIAID